MPRGSRFRCTQPRSFFSGYQDNLGYGFGTALGAKAACPDRAVLSIAGDGGFGYQAMELATAKRHGLAVVVVVFDDGAFGNVRRIQQQAWGGRLIGWDLANPDFCQFADSFGDRVLPRDHRGRAGGAAARGVRAERAGAGARAGRRDAEHLGPDPDAAGPRHRSCGR